MKRRNLAPREVLAVGRRLSSRRALGRREFARAPLVAVRTEGSGRDLDGWKVCAQHGQQMQR